MESKKSSTVIKSSDATGGSTALVSAKQTAALVEISEAIRMHSEIFDLSGDEIRHLKRAFFYSEINNGLVPDAFKGDYRAIFIMSQLAERMRCDLIEVLQGGYFVHGRFGWYAEFLIKRALQLGIFTAIDYEQAGEIGKGTYTVRAVGTRPDGSKAYGTAVSQAMAAGEGWLRNPKYKTMPALMLKKRAATFLIRECAPHIMGGGAISTSDEIEDITSSPGAASVMESNLAAMAQLLGEGVVNNADSPTPQENAASTEPLAEEGMPR